jgi:hypothetical protein
MVRNILWTILKTPILVTNLVNGTKLGVLSSWSPMTQLYRYIFVHFFDHLYETDTNDPVYIIAKPENSYQEAMHHHVTSIRTYYWQQTL